MYKGHDRELGMHRDITRRNFVNGVRVAVIRDQIGRTLEDGGFDPARDIEALPVNRWSHGYAYSYDTLNDPIEWALFDRDDRPCVIGRRRFGRISIANSDAAATLHTDAAIDEAHRAAREQLTVRSRARRSRTRVKAASTSRGWPFPRGPKRRLRA